VKEIRDNGTIIARYVPAGWKEGLSFHSQDDEFIQVGTWKYEKGKKLLAHAHNTVKRSFSHTQEVVHVRKGRVMAHIYGAEKNLIEDIMLHQGDTLILLSGGHGYDIMEDETEVLEVKNGPYPGAEQDRTRI